jgi:hypothetical protein
MNKKEELKNKEMVISSKQSQEFCEESSSKQRDSTQHRWGRKEDKEAFQRLGEHLRKAEISLEDFLIQVGERIKILFRTVSQIFAQPQ